MLHLFKAEEGVDTLRNTIVFMSINCFLIQSSDLFLQNERNASATCITRRMRKVYMYTLHVYLKRKLNEIFQNRLVFNNDFSMCKGNRDLETRL